MQVIGESQLNTGPVIEPPLTVVDARSGWSLTDLQELWRYRELFWCLVLRDIKVRYKQTILGVGWSVVQPLAAVMVFAVFIGWMGKVAEGVENYTLYVLAGMLPWTLFANGVMSAANCLVANERLVTKTYFPRILLPASSVGAAVFDFLVGVLLLGIWIAILGIHPTWRLLFAPVFILLLSFTAFGIGAMLSALIAVQRDFRHILTFGVQLWMFATPGIYLPPEKSPLGQQAREWLSLNPAQGLIVNFRAAVMGEPLDWLTLIVSSGVGLIFLMLGLWYFRRVERTLADTL